MLMLEEALSIACNDNVPPLASHHLVGKDEPALDISGDILIVEDHAMVLSVLQASLRRLCPDVEQVCVRSAGAALEVVSRRWFRVFVDPDVAGVDEGSLAREFARLDLACRCCLITTHPRQVMKPYLQDLECLACISTRMPMEEFNVALAQTALGIKTALGITAPKAALRDNRVPRFTPRHVELLRLLQRGLQNKAIAHELGIAEGTVRNHLHSVMKRMGVHNRMQAAQEAARSGIA
jgi:two-component system, NarL family, response regulator DesR